MHIHVYTLIKHHMYMYYVQWNFSYPDTIWQFTALYWILSSLSLSQDEPDGISSKFKFSIGKHKNKKTPKNSKNPSPPTNHTSSSSPIASSPISPVSSPSVSVPPPPPLLQTTSISPPPSISSTASLPSLPTDTHPLLEGTAPVNHELIIATPPTLITPNVREEATLEQSSSEESLPESNQNSSSPILEGKVSRGRSVGSYLSADDEEIVRAFVSEFVGQRLVPHLEAVLKNLNEWVSPLNPEEIIHIHYPV